MTAPSLPDWPADLLQVARKHERVAPAIMPLYVAGTSWGEGLRDSGLAIIRAAVDGTKHAVVRDICWDLAPFALAGEFDEAEAEGLIVEAAEEAGAENLDNVRNLWSSALEKVKPWITPDEDFGPGTDDVTPAAADPHWRKKMIVTSKGQVLGNQANAIQVIRLAPELHGVFALDLFSGRIDLIRPPPWHGRAPWKAREAKDSDSTRIMSWMQENGVPVGSQQVVESAIRVVAEEHAYHPVRYYLESLEHDGKPRCDTWLIDYMGTEDNALNRAFASMFLIGMVARVYQPGCKLDTMLVLEGEQGIGKSPALRTLAGKPQWFTDHLPDLHDKDALMQIHGVWLVEHAEMDGLSRADTSRIKVFMSTATDRFRPPFGRNVSDHDRQCVFAGTVNPGESGYLADPTGARRFWPVKCAVGWAAGRKIDTKGLAAVRGQLFAEAVARYKAGARWHLPPELEKPQAEQADLRYTEDPWEETIRAALMGLDSVSTSDLASRLQIPVFATPGRSHLRTARR